MKDCIPETACKRFILLLNQHILLKIKKKNKKKIIYVKIFNQIDMFDFACECVYVCVCNFIFLLSVFKKQFQKD